MTALRIERAFLTLPGRQVHYRRAGSGPPVVLLHQSPKSSEELIPLIEMLSADFTVLAPDTPGYGLSDPIVSPDDDVEIDVFADAVAEFFDGMGLERAGLYGLHTGAAIATRFAARYPGRVMALIANGTLIKTPDERADFLAHYLPRFTPSWDGAHLAWAWSRMREQMIYFPWHRRDPSSRVCFPMTLDGLQVNSLALLEAGDNYRTAYGDGLRLSRRRRPSAYRAAGAVYLRAKRPALSVSGSLPDASANSGDRARPRSEDRARTDAAVFPRACAGAVSRARTDGGVSPPAGQPHDSPRRGSAACARKSGWRGAACSDPARNRQLEPGP